LRFADIQAGGLYVDLPLGSFETSRLEVWKALARRFEDFETGGLETIKLEVYVMPSTENF
jgi:hypothetical protein